METNDTIRRAMMLTPQPTLSASFTPRLMARIRRRYRLHTALHNIALTAAGVAVAAAAVAAVVRFAPAWIMPLTPSVSDIRPPEPASLSLSRLLPEMPSAEMAGSAFGDQISYWAVMSGALFLLLAADILLRRRLRRRRYRAK